MHSRAPQIAYFITPHGFGHAARACACMEALQARIPHIGWHLFTQVPEWFFRSSGIAPAAYHPLRADVGLVQRSPWEADMTATLARLGDLLPFRPAQVDRLAETVTGSGCQLVICDIAALGIAAARRAGLPSVLVENFTWDWIYAPYARQNPEFEVFSRILEAWYAAADHHIQAAPWCAAPPAAPALQTPPVSRTPHASAREVRRALKIPSDHRLVLVTMGGVPDTRQTSRGALRLERVSLVIPGNYPEIRRSGHAILLPYHSVFYHPDLIHAADAVVGKAGYSTLAETYSAGTPFAYIARENFRESAVLESFIRGEMTGRPISEAFWDRPGEWAVVGELLNEPRRKPVRPNGAEQIARYLTTVLDRIERF